MPVNPCCCCIPLQTGVKFLAVILVIVESTNLVLILTALMSTEGWQHSMAQAGRDTHDINLIIGTLFFQFLMSLIKLTVNVSLFTGAKRRDVKKCNQWLSIYLFILLINVGVYVAKTFTETDRSSNLDKYWIIVLVDSVFILYISWVVQAFIQEVNLANNPQNRILAEVRVEGRQGIENIMPKFGPIPFQRQPAFQRVTPITDEYPGQQFSPYFAQPPPPPYPGPPQSYMQPPQVNPLPAPGFITEPPPPYPFPSAPAPSYSN